MQMERSAAWKKYGDRRGNPGNGRAGLRDGQDVSCRLREKRGAEKYRDRRRNPGNGRAVLRNGKGVPCRLREKRGTEKYGDRRGNPGMAGRNCGTGKASHAD